MSAARSSPGDLILGVSPADAGRVLLWLWSPAASLQRLGLFKRQAVPAIAERLMRNRPDLRLFVAKGAGL